MSDAKQINLELDALGEPSASHDELSLATESAGDPERLDDADAQITAALFRLAEPSEIEDLDDLASQRAWKKVEGRLGETTGAPPKPDRRGSPRRRIVAVVAVIAAAAVVAIVISPQGGDSAELEALGAQAHVGLEALGVERGREAEDTEAFAKQYAARLGVGEEVGG